MYPEIIKIDRIIRQEYQNIQYKHIPYAQECRLKMNILKKQVENIKKNTKWDFQKQKKLRSETKKFTRSD